MQLLYIKQEHTWSTLTIKPYNNTKETEGRETFTRKQLFHVGLAYRDTW